MEEKETTKSIVLPFKMFKVLQRKADQEDRSVSAVIRTILKEKLVKEGLLES